MKKIVSVYIVSRSKPSFIISIPGTGGALSGISSGEANAVKTERVAIVDSSIKFNRIRHPYRRGVYHPLGGIFHGSRGVTQNLIIKKQSY